MISDLFRVFRVLSSRSDTHLPGNPCMWYTGSVIYAPLLTGSRFLPSAPALREEANGS